MNFSPYCEVSASQCLWVTHSDGRCESILFVANRLPYLWGILNVFSNVSSIFTATKLFHQVISERTKHETSPPQWSWHVTLNLPHVSRDEMSYFVTSSMTQNQNRELTLESAQYGLEVVASRLYIFVVASSPSFSKILFSYFTNRDTSGHISQWCK